MTSQFDEYIKFLRALASEERLAIVKKLMEQELCVTEVEKQFFMEQSTASHHLNMLKKAGIAHVNRHGKQMIYGINKEILRSKYEEFLKFMGL